MIKNKKNTTKEITNPISEQTMKVCIEFSVGKGFLKTKKKQNGR